MPHVHPPILETAAAAGSSGLAARWWILADEAATTAWATRLAEQAAAQMALRQAFIALQGPLGAGKTTLVRAMLRALGVSGRIKSPSYAVMEPYLLADGTEATHFDFYRFSAGEEWADAGLRDVFARPGLKLAEWPEHAGAQLPTPDLILRLALQDDGSRLLQAQSGSMIGNALLDALP